MLADVIERMAETIGEKKAGQSIANALRDTGRVLMAGGVQGVTNLGQDFVTQNLGQSMDPGAGLPNFGGGRGQGVGFG